MENFLAFSIISVAQAASHCLTLDLTSLLVLIFSFSPEGFASSFPPTFVAFSAFSSFALLSAFACGGLRPAAPAVGSAVAPATVVVAVLKETAPFFVNVLSLVRDARDELLPRVLRPPVATLSGLSASTERAAGDAGSSFASKRKFGLARASTVEIDDVSPVISTTGQDHATASHSQPVAEEKSWKRRALSSNDTAEASARLKSLGREVELFGNLVETVEAIIDEDEETRKLICSSVKRRRAVRGAPAVVLVSAERVRTGSVSSSVGT